MVSCRHCGAVLSETFLDLGNAPFSNAYRTSEQRDLPEVYYPLRLLVCTECWLVQTQDFAGARELFDENYAYFSSTSESWLAHARLYAEAMRSQLCLGASSFVVEIASNDGYLLRNFVAAGIPCLGIEPTASTATVAESAGIPVIQEFFGHTLAQTIIRQYKHADLIVGNNVFAHVPDINDFTAGLATLLGPSGTVTLEFPHLMRLIEGVQFDTAYHEHFSYLSLYTADRILGRAGLRIYHVEQLTTHGGSLRIFGCHQSDPRPQSDSVEMVLSAERRLGMRSIALYKEFQCRANHVKNTLLMFLIEQRRSGRSVAAYGAAAKGNTLLNFAGVRPDLLPYVCDAAPSKQGKYMPGSGIPIMHPNALVDRRPDYVLILPWNIADEVLRQQRHVAQHGTRFMIALPTLRELT